MENCPFCQIIAHSLSATILYEDEQAIAIQDAHPLTPVHILVIPKIHIASLNEITPEQSSLLGQLLLTARKIAFAKVATVWLSTLAQEADRAFSTCTSTCWQAPRSNCSLGGYVESLLQSRRRSGVDRNAEHSLHAGRPEYPSLAAQYRHCCTRSPGSGQLIPKPDSYRSPG